MYPQAANADGSCNFVQDDRRRRAWHAVLSAVYAVDLKINVLEK